MLEQAIQQDAGPQKQPNLSKTASQRSDFLKKKPRYNPLESIGKNKGEMTKKGIEKKRVLKQDQADEEEPSVMSGGPLMIDLHSKSFVWQESDPLQPNKTKLPPSLLKKFQLQQMRTSKFFKNETGVVIGAQGPQSPVHTQEAEETVRLGLEELEKIYQIYHGGKKTNNYFQSTSILREKNSSVPVLSR